ALAASQTQTQQKLPPQKRLASDNTEVLHVLGGVEAARQAAAALFSGEVRGLDATTLGAIADDLGAVERSRAELAASEPPTVGTLLRELGLASSNREVREFLGGGAVRMNGEVVKEDRPVGVEDVLDGGYTLVRRGRKNWAAVRWS
ncbi:MAG: S4 domain-containing protein, partial [Planctomycetota bacterium]|nr:S4 domain-containing protein [Planctomycetota bacterium]